MYFGLTPRLVRRLSDHGRRAAFDTAEREEALLDT